MGGDIMDVISYALSKKYTDEKNTEWKVKIAGVEKELNNFKSVINQVNVNQEAKQLASGYGIVSLPKNAANGQVSVTVKGNTETDEEGNTKSTIGAMRLKSVGKNLFDGKYENGILSGLTDVTFIASVNGRVAIVKIIGGETYTIKKYSTSNRLGIASFINKPNNTDVSVSSLVNHDSTQMTYTTPPNANYLAVYVSNISEEPLLQIEKGTIATPYEPYIESNAYVVAKDGDKIVNLRSLPNGVADEIRLAEGNAIIRIGAKTNIVSGTVINYDDMAESGTYYAWNDDNETETGIKGDTLGINNATLIYQLAEPEIIPIQVSGSLTSHPNGTVFIEPIVADAGVYTDKIEVLHDDLPIKAIEKVSKVDFMTGVETELDISQAEISEDKLSFTHPDLSEGDIVFFEYEYDVESTEGETEVEYYDSRYVVKDDVTGKFYKWNVKVSNGTPTIEVVEV